MIWRWQRMVPWVYVMRIFLSFFGPHDPQTQDFPRQNQNTVQELSLIIILNFLLFCNTMPVEDQFEVDPSTECSDMNSQEPPVEDEEARKWMSESEEADLVHATMMEPRLCFNWNVHRHKLWYTNIFRLSLHMSEENVWYSGGSLIQCSYCYLWHRTCYGILAKTTPKRSSFRLASALSREHKTNTTPGL